MRYNSSSKLYEPALVQNDTSYENNFFKNESLPDPNSIFGGDDSGNG